MRVKDDRLLKIILVADWFKAKRNTVRPRMGSKDVIRKYLTEIGTSWGGVKIEALNRSGRKRSVRSCVPG